MVEEGGGCMESYKERVDMRSCENGQGQMAITVTRFELSYMCSSPPKLFEQNQAFSADNLGVGVEIREGSKTVSKFRTRRLATSSIGRVPYIVSRANYVIHSHLRSTP